MSSAIHVFLRDPRLPTVEEWNAAIKAAGFNVIVDSFDLRKDDGYLPASLNGEDSGFEWYLSPVSETEGVLEIDQDIGDSDLRASMHFSASRDESAAASIAGAVLAKLSDGYYLDPETENALLRGDDAVVSARKALADWERRSKEPAKHIAAAITSILVPVLEPLGFVQATPGWFARLSDDIVQSFGVEKRDTDFRAGWAGQAVFPLREFLAVTFSPGVRINYWEDAETPEQANASMKKLVNQFLEFLYPWFEETKTPDGMLEYLMEFGRSEHHRIFDIACLLAKLDRRNEAVEYLNSAILKYEEDGRDWCAKYLAQCEELLNAIQAGTALGILEKWKAESLHNLGYEKLLTVAERERSPSSKSPKLPPIIPATNFRTAAAFSREVVRPAIITMMRRAMPGFLLAEACGHETYFVRNGGVGLFDFVIFKTQWHGAISVELAANYDSSWRGRFTKIGCSDAGGGVQRSYSFGRSESDLQAQLFLTSGHLVQNGAAFFASARQIMLGKKMVQFGRQEVIGNLLSNEGKAALRKELSASDHRNPPTNKRYVELCAKLAALVEQGSIPKEEGGNEYLIAQELLLANLAVDELPRNSVRNIFRRWWGTK